MYAYIRKSRKNESLYSIQQVFNFRPRRAPFARRAFVASPILLKIHRALVQLVYMGLKFATLEYNEIIFYN